MLAVPPAPRATSLRNAQPAEAARGSRH
ncbi:hypothetical protein A2U01_0115101, partial [Trifolium medium]|nr:hypothetical protein [Trifolium medium]